MKKARNITALLAWTMWTAVFLVAFISEQEAAFVIGLVLFATSCLVVWIKSERDYPGVAFAFQCFGLLLVMVTPSLASIMVYPIALDFFRQIDDKSFEKFVWGVGMGFAIWGLPSALVGGLALLTTNWWLRREGFD